MNTSKRTQKWAGPLGLWCMIQRLPQQAYEGALDGLERIKEWASPARGRPRIGPADPELEAIPIQIVPVPVPVRDRYWSDRPSRLF
jgi:hypothetical protein